MANESTTSTINDISYSAAIEPSFQDYARDWMVATQHTKKYDIKGRGAANLDVPSLTSILGTVGNAGAAYDAEFDLTQGTALANTARGTDKATITGAEYGVLVALTDNVVEDQVSGFDILQELINDSARILQAALEKDLVDLFSSLSGSVGTTTVDLSLANMSSALVGIRNNGVRAPDGIVYVLGHAQAEDLENAYVSTNAAAAIHPTVAAELLNVTNGPMQGMADGHFTNFRGNRCYVSGAVATANMGADESGAAFVPWTPANDRMCCFGEITSRDFRVETDRDVALRGCKIASTFRKASGELLDAAGKNIVTDA